MAPAINLIRGDAAERWPLPDNSLDSIVTDPPYGLKFMGKSWDDKGGPAAYQAWSARWADEAFRVLKPGGFLLAFGATRMAHRMACGFEDAGFEIVDTIEWLYLSGMPKAQDVGKLFDKRRGDRPDVLQVTAFIAEARDRAGLTNGDIDRHFGFNGMAGHWTSTKTQPLVPKWDQWVELKRLLGCGDDLDAEVWRLGGLKGQPGENWEKREVVGQRAKLDSFDQDSRFVSGEAAEYDRVVLDITAPASDAAKRWDGWKTPSLKPAHEPIVMARKPFSGTYCDNLDRWGVGAINVDACRIPGPSWGTHKKGAQDHLDAINLKHGKRTRNYTEGRETIEISMHDAGRFPANCVTVEEGAWFSPWFNVTPQDLSKKAAPGEKNAGCDDLPRGNDHATVKPVGLIRWLQRLVTPPGGRTGSPFLGSGTDAVAAILEGFGFWGMNLPDRPGEEYWPIIEARVAWAQCKGEAAVTTEQDKRTAGQPVQAVLPLEGGT